ncbi:MAG: hypothetical protein JWL61_1916 [Gemmatimonadetes bacterium]|nr:hypothetical protein [Gemmatimonadota bacterium]
MFHIRVRNRCIASGMMAAVMLVVPARAHASVAPSTKDFMRALDARIQRAKPREVFQRTIVFADVSAGEAEGKVFPFTVTATIHDYNPGWPPDHYYGRTCVTRIVRTRYTMLRDRLGEWTVETKADTPQPICTDNPTEGTSAFPLDSLRGTRVGTSTPLPALMTKRQVNVTLRLGDYACTGPGGRIVPEMKFRLNPDKTYTDLDGTRGGTYVFDGFSGTLKFRGGFLDKKGGPSVESLSVFLVTPTLTCAPW